jgi:CheY-like chemotaxis protein
MEELRKPDEQNVFQEIKTINIIGLNIPDISQADSCENDNIPVKNYSIETPITINTSLNHRPVFNFSGKTILAVDDVSFNLNLINIFFKNTGAQILFASNGKEAVDACISNPEVNIVLMDIQMPVMNGLDATREILKLNPAMPVVAVTAFVHCEDKQRCFEAGCIEFLPKPCSRDDMLRMVNNLLQDSSYS